MEIDPDGHAERSQNNAERRCVSRPRPAGEGLCQVRLLLPAMDALLLDATLDAIAASARACGEKRALGQLRADAITAMSLSVLRTSQMAAFSQPTQGVSADRAEGRSGGDRSQVRAPSPVTSTSSRASQDDSDIDVTAGAGQGRLLPDGVPLEGLLGALSGLVGSTSPWWTPSATEHLPLPAGIRINVNVTVPLNSLVGLAPPDDGPTGSGGPRDGGPGESAAATTDPLNGAASPGGRRSLPTAGGRSLPTAGGRSLPGSSGRNLPEPGPAAPATLFSAVRASSPAASLSTAPVAQPAASTSASLSAMPAQVAQVRIGARSVAVPAMTAWALAAGGTWRRLVTDPVGGTVVDVGRTRYRPPAGLADLVRARDRACVFPTCQTPAERCDIDHLTAWSQGGTTSLDNLVVLCEAHHRLKHTPGWALTKDQTTGVLSWHTPDKTVYQRHPDGTITRLPHKVGPRQRYVPGSVVPADLSQQISPDILNRLNAALNNTSTGTGIGADPTGSPRLETRGPQPGQKAGAYETTPYPQATHTLGLAPLMDEAPPF